MTERRHLNSLTSARAIAATSVLIHHTRGAWKHYDWVDYFCSVGWLGVSFFYILSGFVLMWTFNPQVRAGTFFQKRICRIYPLHFLTLIISLVSFAVFLNPLAGYVGTVPGTFLNFLLIHDWVPGHPEIRQAWNGVSWSLSCEFFFYVVALAFFKRVIRLTSKRAVIEACLAWAFLLVTAIVASGVGAEAVSDFLIYSPIPRFMEFGVGAVGAIVVRGWLARARSVHHLVWLTGIALSFIPIVAYLWAHTETVRSSAVMNIMTIPGFTLIIVYLAVVDLLNARGPFVWMSSRWMIVLGEASFALYMIHALFLGFVTQVFRHVGFHVEKPLAGDLVTVGFAIVSLGLSVCVYQWVEKPVQRWVLALTKLVLPPVKMAPDA